jgi:hypothetical protein
VLPRLGGDKWYYLAVPAVTLRYALTTARNADL